MYTKELSEKIEDRLLATHISDNPNFEGACMSGNASQILAIVEAEMQKNNLYTAGSKKLQADITRMLQGKTRVSTYVGQNILMFVWNSRLAGIGLAVK
jgi:hypothetical protein